MLRAIASLGGVLVWSCAAGQGPPMNVSVANGEPLVWMGECVRTSAVRDPRSDPCPGVESYVGRTRQDIDALNAKAGTTGRMLHYWNPPGALEKVARADDKVTAQWPRPEDFSDSGWPRRYPVFVLFEEGKTSGPPETCPVRNSKGEPCIPDQPPPPPHVPVLVGESGTRAAQIAAGSGFVAQEFLLSDGKPGIVVFQSPPAGLAAPAGSRIEYIVAHGRRSPVEVPNVVGCDAPEAIRRLQAATRVVFPELPTPLAGNYVLAQKPGGGRTAGDAIAVSLITVPASGLTDAVRAAIRATPQAANCELPPKPESPPPCRDCARCPVCEPEEKIVYRDRPVATVVPIVGAAGAGALSGYLLARLLGRRRQDDDEDDGAKPAGESAILRARVHPDNRGIQEMGPGEYR
jgi:hypothetical protein